MIYYFIQTSAARIHDRDLIFLIGNDAQKLKRLLARILIGMHHSFGNKDHISGFDMICLFADGDGCLTAQNILFMLDGIRMARHAPILLHREFAQGEIRAFPG